MIDNEENIALMSHCSASGRLSSNIGLRAERSRQKIDEQFGRVRLGAHSKMQRRLARHGSQSGNEGRGKV